MEIVFQYEDRRPLVSRDSKQDFNLLLTLCIDLGFNVNRLWFHKLYWSFKFMEKKNIVDIFLFMRAALPVGTCFRQP
jgi:hypothetical protein